MHRCERAAVKDGYCTRHHVDYVAPSERVHIHSEQFDGCLHAACGAIDAEGPRHSCIEFEEEFMKLPRKVLCDKCVELEFPHGFEDTRPTGGSDADA